MEGVRLEVSRSRISRDEVMRLFNELKRQLLEIPANANCKLTLAISVEGELQ